MKTPDEDIIVIENPVSLPCVIPYSKLSMPDNYTTLVLGRTQFITSNHTICRFLITDGFLWKTVCSVMDFILAIGCTTGCRKSDLGDN
ncbi:hypothetical protein CEXT_92641 [Caerostris extrusa]|uniref:Uncharacterized protein n=1 Tax=Caerostris extrusa TaxID=172846 RepID=A0AAV4S6B9_CAEEX|nr:hypothetical protein CEXT_92641 [Caerostris extrusa]